MTAPWLIAMDWRNALFVHWPVAAKQLRAMIPRELEHRLIERYCFFTADRRGRTVRGDVLHPPWPLRDATVTIAKNTLLTAAGIALGNDAPLVNVSKGVAARARWPIVTRRPRASG